MKKIYMKEKLEKENNVTYVSSIEYCGKEYIKAIKSLKKGIEYLYFKVDNEEITRVEDNDLIEYFRRNYEVTSSNIVY